MTPKQKSRSTEAICIVCPRVLTHEVHEDHEKKKNKLKMLRPLRDVRGSFLSCPPLVEAINSFILFILINSPLR
jgi:hypothetical protein